MRFPHRMLGTSLVCALSLVMCARAWADCVQIYEQARTMTALSPLRSLYAAASQNAACDADFLAALGRRVAVTYLQAVQTLPRGSADPAAESMLREALHYARPWQALAMLGDMAHDRKTYSPAARYYQDALEVIQDVQATPQPPSHAIIQTIFKRAEASRLLADEHVPVPVNRSTHQQGGVYASHMRGFVPTQRAIPITFLYNSTQFDAKGERAAAELLRTLQEQKPATVTLIGHTDPRGSASYNLDLSKRRAAALSAYVNRGYRGRVRTDGRGEDEPYQPDDPGKYTQEELYRLHRRVELRME